VRDTRQREADGLLGPWSATTWWGREKGIRDTLLAHRNRVLVRIVRQDLWAVVSF